MILKILPHLFNSVKTRLDFRNPVPEEVSGALRSPPVSTVSAVFQSYDRDHDGLLSREDLMESIIQEASDCRLQITSEKAITMVNNVFDAASIPSNGMLSEEEFCILMQSYLPDINTGDPFLQSEAAQSSSAISNPPRPNATKLKESAKAAVQRLQLTFSSYASEFVILIIYVFFCMLLFAVGMSVAYVSNPEMTAGRYIYSVAKGFGMVLDINCSIIILPILHWTVTIVRRTKWISCLPLDALPKFHIICAVCIGVAGLGHTVAHIMNFNAVLHITNNATKNSSSSLIDYLFVPQQYIPYGLFHGLAPITGWIIIAVFLVIVLSSLPTVRHSRHFQVFYWFHKLTFLFWIVLIFHSRNFWKYFLFFAMLLIVEKCHKYYVAAKNSTAEITEATLLPSQVIHLIIKRPKNFVHNPGDFIFVKIPAVSWHEWHPFTISSAPEIKDYIWLHIRIVGNWTTQLYNYLKRQEKCTPVVVGQQSVEKFRAEIVKDLDAVTVLHRISKRKSQKYKENKQTKSLEFKNNLDKVSIPLASPIPLCIDGPYGTSTAAIFDTEHAVLIGSGIGITPMASILGSIIHHFRRNRVQCPHCDKEVPFTNNAVTMYKRPAKKLKKVDFIWVCRDQTSIQWFIDLLEEWEREQITLENANHPGENFVTAQIYITSVPKGRRTSAVGLSLGMNLYYKQTRTDILTGLKSQTKTGRPKWSEVFDAIAHSGKGQVRVFFCGSQQLSREIRQHCAVNKFDFSWENF
ncbi:NADPH oxidase 5-like isoform X1 [Paramacrobiotus metropolitanus]|uniref:NADPH oxidase 5-like isoform X1 n=2 Tax=Paramacrobiotus metropolitanus TaxID=2943436 RepID=UPI0024462977|nr:NADPH oxidase 5-like isoform X1 [Paramacrobiotus metropolitanus]